MGDVAWGAHRMNVIVLVEVCVCVCGKNKFWLPSQQVLSKYPSKDELGKCQDAHWCLEKKGAFHMKWYLLGMLTLQHS